MTSALDGANFRTQSLLKLVSNLSIAASPVDMNTGAEIVLRDAHPIKEGTETSKYKPELLSLLHKT